MTSLCDVCGGEGRVHAVALPRQGLAEGRICSQCVRKVLHFADRHLPRRLLGDYLEHRRRTHIAEIAPTRD